ncbi:hypothetical protein E4U10_008403, partial [Claviceps purpurea]
MQAHTPDNDAPRQGPGAQGAGEQILPSMERHGYAPDTVAPLHESAEQILSSLEPDQETSIIDFEQLVSSESGVEEPKEHERFLLSASSDHYQAAMRSDAVTAKYMCYTAAIPQWPQASPDGYGYAVHLQNTEAEAAEKPWDHVQYGLRRIHPQAPSRSDFLGDLPVMLHKFNCSGIEHCEHLDETLLQPAVFSDHESFLETQRGIKSSLNDPRSRGLLDAVANSITELPAKTSARPANQQFMKART